MSDFHRSLTIVPLQKKLQEVITTEILWQALNDFILGASGLGEKSEEKKQNLKETL